MEIFNETMIETLKNVIEDYDGNEFDNDKYYAVVDGWDIDGNPIYLQAVADSYEDAAEQLWRDMCDQDCRFNECEVDFVHGHKGFSSDTIQGAMHAVFDHGRRTFEEMLMLEFKYNAGFAISD